MKTPDFTRVSAPIRSVLLTSRQNFVWHSMQEIIPMIERTWSASTVPHIHDVEIIDIDQARLGDYSRSLLEAHNVVFTCFTCKSSRLGEILRKQLSLNARYIIYLHNQATIACWPYHQYGLGNVLREKDLFISSCTRDAHAFSLSFKEARVETIPFILPNDEPQVLPQIAKEGEKETPFVYIGRISVQKNLHLLLTAFRIFLEKNQTYAGNLRIYGGEDRLGSPNMGMQQKDYLTYLADLTERLGIKEKVQFFGHLQREEIYKDLSNRRHIFVSPSLHSDENFGMAAFRSLSLGHRAVLSNWGGHSDFKNSFGENVFLVPAKGGESGPWISPVQFADAMTRALKSPDETRSSFMIPECYKLNRISRKILEISTESTTPGAPLHPSELAERLLKKRNTYCSANPDQLARIFEDYSDPDSHLFFWAYGMEKQPEPPAETDSIYLLPWVRIERDEIVVSDPHRGHFNISTTEAGPFAVVDSWRKQISVSYAVAFRILNEGWAYSGMSAAS